METRTDSDRGASYAPPAAPVEQASIFEDFIDIFHSPSQVFARRVKSGFGLHLLIVSVVAAGFAFANRGYMAQIWAAEADRGAAKAMAENPQITPEMMENMRGMQEGMGAFFGYAGTPVIILVMALFVWLAARLIAGAKVTYGQSAMITTLAWIPRLVGMFVTTMQVALMDTSNETSMFGLSLSPARFMDPATANAKLYGLGGSFELFSIWSMILIGIGIAVMGGAPRARAYIAAAVLFVLGTIPLLMR